MIIFEILWYQLDTVLPQEVVNQWGGELDEINGCLFCFLITFQFFQVDHVQLAVRILEL